MLREIDDLQSIPKTKQLLPFKLVRITFPTEWNSQSLEVFRSSIELKLSVSMLLNNSKGPIHFLFEQEVTDIESIYADTKYSVLRSICSDVYAMKSNDSYIGMQFQNVFDDKIDLISDHIDQEISTLFSPNDKMDFVIPPKEGSVRAFSVKSAPTVSSAALSSMGSFLINQCKLHGGIFGVPLLGKTRNELESNVTLNSLAKFFKSVFVLGGKLDDEDSWKSTHLILKL